MAKMEKNPHEDVPEEWRDAVEAATTDDIKKKVAEVALAQAELMKAKKEDADLAEKKEQVKEASAIYREGSKLNKAKIEYAKMILDSRGAK